MINREQQTLIITMEECAEVAQMCSKILRFRHMDSELQHQEKTILLSEEVGDLLLMVDLLAREGLIDLDIAMSHRDVKRQKLSTYSNLFDGD